MKMRQQVPMASSSGRLMEVQNLSSPSNPYLVLVFTLKTSLIYTTITDANKANSLKLRRCTNAFCTIIKYVYTLPERSPGNWRVTP